AAYWRSPYFPVDKPQTFTISPQFAPGTDAAAKTSFVRKFELRSKSPWCRLTQETVYLRSEQTARVYVEYDAGQLVEPGVHVGVVEALADGRVAFRLLSTIVIPHRVTAEQNFTRRFETRTTEGWTPHRYFILVPPGASAMKLTCSAPEGAESKARMNYAFDPTGKGYRDRRANLDTEGGRRKIERFFTDDLIPGVWEVDIYSNRPDQDWPYDFSVQFFGLYADPAEIDSWSDGSGELIVTNLFGRPLPGAVDGKIEGFGEHQEDNFEGLEDELSYSVTLGEEFRAVRVELEMTPEAYATTTDIGVAVEDQSGEAIASTAFSNRTCTLTARHPSLGETADLKVVIRGGFAVEDDKRETPITVKIDQLLATPLGIDVTRGDSGNVLFVPGVPIKLEFELDGDLPEAPDDTVPVGYLRVRERGTQDLALRVPLVIVD
ncbi:MAG: hypothetical protein GY842_12110, partial [bacterium]|nr:hypothetical protein [bacterium]